MKLIEVNTPATESAFKKVNFDCNKFNPNYVRPLDNEVDAVFDRQKNKNYEHGNTIRWILEDKGKIIGRIAAFISSKYMNKGTDFPVGGIGFFDCINDQAAANLLFDIAKKWLQDQGMEAMDGPINFGDRDKWWGLLVDGFDRPPTYGMSFCPPYYRQLFENYGFQDYYHQVYYKMNVEDELPERFKNRYERFLNRSEYSVHHIDRKKIEKYAGDFVTVYNVAWAQHKEAKEVTTSQIVAMFKKMSHIIDENLIWFAYYKDEPISMWINIPDLNEYFRHFNGKFGILEKLRLLWLKKHGECKTFTGIAFGVVPKFQALGVDSYMIYVGAERIKALGKYKIFEMGWSGDWNPKMINIYKSLGAKQSRKLITYRYLFNLNRTFERHPVI